MKRSARQACVSSARVGKPPENKRFATDPKNIAVFRLKSHKVTERIVKEILALNGMVVKDAEKAKNA